MAAAFLVLGAPPLCAAPSSTISTERGSVIVEEVATGLDRPWGLAFLPDGRMLVTERPGRLRIVTIGGIQSVPVSGVPAVDSKGQGGLFDVAIPSDFDQSGLVYLSYAEPRAGGNGTTVASARLDGTELVGLKVIFRQMPTVESQAHFGGRLVFAHDGTLFVTLGERSLKHFAVRAQDLESHFGKVVRIHPDGSIPADNPLVNVPGARPEIWSYGHRNPQGAVLDPQTGELWVSEHGARGGDELNQVRPGANFGWPLVTHGVAYSGDVIGVGRDRAGIDPPVHTWVPSIATSGLAFYTGRAINEWAGNVFVGALAGSGLARLEILGGKVVHEERLLIELKERIRDVRMGPDGFLYLLTDNPRGRVLRITPGEQ